MLYVFKNMSKVKLPKHDMGKGLPYNFHTITNINTRRGKYVYSLSTSESGVITHF